jgi:hypothetical protein
VAFFPIFIQYDNARKTDGFGAQGTRIVGVYAIARFFRIKYVHRGIVEFSDRRELMGSISDERAYSETLRRLNCYLQPESQNSWKPPEKAQTIFIYNLGFRILLKYLLKSLLRPNTYVLSVCLPFGITDRLPITYVKVRDSFNYGGPINEIGQESRTIVAHIRTGQNSPSYPRTQLSAGYFDKLIFSEKYGKLNCDKWIIHTDFLESDFSDKPNSANVIEFRDLFAKLASFHNVEIRHYAKIEDVFLDMRNAHVLIMGKSALSYLAALIGNGAVVYPSSHGHSPLPQWKIEYVS